VLLKTTPLEARLEVCDWKDAFLHSAIMKKVKVTSPKYSASTPMSLFFHVVNRLKTDSMDGLAA
jgi:hypothetical protein